MPSHEEPGKRADENQQVKLLAFYRAVAAGDRDEIEGLLKRSAWLARTAATSGASRQTASSYFLAQIGHYVYEGDTALHLAAAAYDPALVQTLIASGANVHARNRRGAEPLHYAADGSPGSARWNPEAQSQVIAILIRAGADPNAENKDGVTPLHRAVRTRSAAAVRALLANGADVHRRNGTGSTPLHLAVQNTGKSGSGSSAAHQEQAEIIKVLLKHGAKPSDHDVGGKAVQDCVKSEWIRDVLERNDQGRFDSTV